MNSYVGYPGVFFIQQHLWWIIPFLILDSVFRAIALWKSARHNQMAWFIVLIIINSLGILPAVYLLFFQAKSSKKK